MTLELRPRMTKRRQPHELLGQEHSRIKEQLVQRRTELACSETAEEVHAAKVSIMERGVGEMRTQQWAGVR